MSISERNKIIEDTCYKLTIAMFFLLMVKFIIPLPGDRGPWLNTHWPVAKEQAIQLTKTKTKKDKKNPTETIDEKEVMAKAIYKVYGRAFPKHLIDYVYSEASRKSLEGDIVMGLIAAESSFIPTAKSSVGAVGYAQVWPKWHQDKIKGRDILNPYVNIEVATSFLRECMDNNDQRLYEALACYNGSKADKDASDRYYQRVTYRLHELSLAALEVAGI